jgi:hypothetical protein
MLYLGIDQHARQITISLRDEGGDVLMARQVSTRPDKIHEFSQRRTIQRLQCGESLLPPHSTGSSWKTTEVAATLPAKLGRLAKS